MKTLSLCVVAAALLCPGVFAADVSAKPIAPLAWLVNGVWSADATQMGNGMQRIETRYRWSDNGSFIRFTTHFITDKAEIKRYDGNFFWNPAQSTLAMWYMDPDNKILEGPIKAQDNTTDFFFTGPNFAGKPSDLRVRVTRKSADAYNWAMSEKQSDSWKPLASLDYTRKPD